MYDILIKNGNIYDGYGKESFRADIGIKNGVIAKIGKIRNQAKEVIDADGYIVTPGFIDTHGHSDIISWAMDNYDHKIRQGVTTEVTGSCGLSIAPTNPKHLDLLDDYISTIKCGTSFSWEWQSFDEYIAFLKKQKFPLNLVSLLGHGTIRIATMGFNDSIPTKEELSEMKNFAEEAMKTGAFGLSVGLVYPPGAYSDKEELIELCKIVGNYGGIFSTHIRNESDNLIESLKEVIFIAEKSGVTLLISHLKAMGKSNWGKSEEAVKLIEKARGNNINVWADQYPYTANSTFLNAVVPPKELNQGVVKFVNNLKNNSYKKAIIDKIENDKDGDWENFVANAGGWHGVMVLSLPETPKWNGKLITEISEEINLPPGEAFCKLLIDNHGEGLVVTFTMNDEDLEAIMKTSFQMIGSDGLPGQHGSHPRIYGTFPRVIKKYVKEKNIISLTKAIKKMTYIPAKVFDLSERGVIEENKIADINIINLQRIEDRATYRKSERYPVGYKNVLIRGKVVVENDKVVSLDNGKVLTK